MNEPITPTELRACLDRYGLRVLERPQALGHGKVSRIAFVHTQHGPVVVKRHSFRFEDTQIYLALEAHAHASTHDLAPPLLSTVEGQRAVLLGPFWYSVTEHAETGRTAERDHRALGRALAALHGCLSQFAPTNEGTGFLQLHQHPISVLRSIQAERATSPEIHDEIEWRVSVLEKIGPTAEDLAASPRQWIHGDVRSDNLLAARSPGRWWFIDFDQISRFPRPYEIVRAFATSFCMDVRPVDCPRRFAEYLAAYRDARPIPAHEAASMIDLYITVQAGETRTFTTRDGEVRGMADYAYSRRRLLAWFVEHRDDLTAAAQEGV